MPTERYIFIRLMIGWRSFLSCQPTLLTLLRILFLGRIGSISYVLPIRQNIDILNRDIRVLCRNYNSELVAFAARLGEKFDDSKLREAFITADFVEAETKRQEELQIKVYGNAGCGVWSLKWIAEVFYNVKKWSHQKVRQRISVM